MGEGWPKILAHDDTVTLYHQGEILREWRVSEFQDLLSVELGEPVWVDINWDAFVVRVSACGRSAEIDVFPALVASVKKARQAQDIEPSTVSIPASELHGKERS